MKGGEKMTKENRVERHIINKNHKMFNICNQYCKLSKDLYNHANYIVRQEFIKNDTFLNYSHMAKLMKTEESFKTIGSNSGQHTLKILERNWKSFFVAIKDWSKNKSKYLGKPRLPNYLDKEKGRFICVLTNTQTLIKGNDLYFSFKPFKPYNGLIKVKFKGKHMQTRIIPKIGYYVIEVAYEIEVPETRDYDSRIIGIDLGLNNLMTIQNNFNEKSFVVNGRPLKSMNQYYNMKKGKLQSELKKVNGLNWSNKLSQLTMKRDCKIDNYIHRATRYMVDYCRAFNVDTVVIGKNDTWKQEFKRQRNFVQIPFEKLIWQLQYKLRDIGIKVILTEESYTSKASFIDNDEMTKGTIFSGKRIKRGLYQTNDKQLINADVNGASNIIRKVFPNAFADGIKGVDFHPSIVNL